MRLPTWLTLTKPLASIDIESTTLKEGGKPDAATDRIIDLAITKYGLDGTTTTGTWRVNPGVAITASATAIHGITNLDVYDLFSFKEYASGIMASLDGHDLVGFNLDRYDVPLLYEELARNGVEWDLTRHRIFDAGVIMARMEERTLTAAVRMYLDRDHTQAHGADADSQAALEVFAAQLDRYDSLKKMTLDQISQFSTRTDDGRNKADVHGKFLRDHDNNLIYNFGKNMGLKVKDDLSYACWMLGANFPAHTRATLTAEIDHLSCPEEVTDLDLLDSAGF